jgi:hypothetical protein
MNQQSGQPILSESVGRPKGPRWNRSCCLFAFSPILGAALGVLAFFVLTSGWLLGWKEIESPPEEADQIIQIDGPMIWIATSAGTRYLNAASETCRSGCWVQVADIEAGHPTRGDLGWSPQTCDSPPPILGAVQTKAECKINYWTDDNSAYALRSDGKILAWHYSIGKEWTLVELVVFGLAGAIVVFLVGAVVFLISRFRGSRSTLGAI